MPPHADVKYTRFLNLEKKQETKPVSTPEYLNRFRSGFTLTTMMCTVENDFDADPFTVDQNSVKG